MLRSGGEAWPWGSTEDLPHFPRYLQCALKHEVDQAKSHSNDEIPARAKPASEGSCTAMHIAAMDPRPGEMADHASTGGMIGGAGSEPSAIGTADMKPRMESGDTGIKPAMGVKIRDSST